MKKNRFEQLVEDNDKKAEAARSDDRRIRKARLPVSADAKGNSMRLLLDPSEELAATEFLQLMRKHGFAGSEKLSLSAKRTRRALIVHELHSEPYKKTAKLIRKITWTKLWQDKGYFIGAYYPKNTSPIYRNCCMVYLCSDGKLRCRRSEPIFKSKYSRAVGYGTIPTDKEMADKLVFSTGKFDTSTERGFWPFKSLGLEGLLRTYVETNIINKR